MPKTEFEPKSECECQSEDYEIIDVFGIGNLTDVHMPSDISEDELVQRFQSAIETAKRMGGKFSDDTLEELGLLSAPRMTWEDFILITIGSKKEGVGRNDWGTPRSRPLFYGQYLPKKRLDIFRILVLVDRSGSVPKEDSTYGVSQIQALGESIEGWVVCFDTQPHYQEATQIDSGKLEDLLKIQFAGGGGTLLAPTLYTYEKELGSVDLVVIITDGGIFDLQELNKRGTPNVNTEFLWLLSDRNPNFRPSFGRIFQLNNDRK